MENLNLNAVLEKMVFQKIRKKEILRHHVVLSNLVLYTGDLIELKNLLLSYIAKKLKKKWVGAMIVKVNFITKKLK